MSRSRVPLIDSGCDNAVRHGGGGRCRLEAGAEVADVIIEDRGPGLSGQVLHALLSDLAGPGGLDSVRKLSTHLVLQNLPSGGVRARAVLVPRRTSRVDLGALAAKARLSAPASAGVTP